EDGLLIYEHPDPLPLLFLPRAAVRQGERPLRWVREQPDFHQTALAAGIPGGEATWRSHQASSGTITLSRRSAPHVAARARLDEGRLLASSIYQDGNWHLLVDGRRVSTVLTNTAFVGAWLEPGEHALELLYRPRSFVLGCGLAGLALALGLAWWVPSPSTRRFSITTRTHPWPIASSA
ncbi:MAG: YfhO family protein, partial [Acidobacteriota bacterium]